MKNISFKNKKILITGATGSIGFELVKQLTHMNCKTIRAFSNDENGLFELSSFLRKNSEKNLQLSKVMQLGKLRFLLGDVRDYNRCLEICRDVDYVIHAAALKHVAICEYNPFEAIKTNVVGTENMIKASLHNNIKKFLLISTDKVVSPTNVMGSSKLQAEKITISANEIVGNHKSVFSCVRFGNVLGSRGSVIPTFINLLKRNQDIHLTDKNMKRFVMTINNSVELIIKCLKLMKGSEIFILKSMKCFKIHDLAKSLILHFNKKNKKPNKIIITNKSMGEKIEENLFTMDEISFIDKKKDLFFVNFNKKKLNNKTQIDYIEKFRKSNFNFVNQKNIIKFLKQNQLLND